MPGGLEGLLLLLLSFVATFTVARLLSRRWRRKNEAKRAAEARRGESRQVRRARERRQKN